MMTVHEVRNLTGVSIRTLQYYDSIGLLHPAGYTEAGYRLYDDTALESLQQILLFRELEFPLREIKGIIQSPAFDRQKVLDQQIKLLQLKKEHLEKLIDLARGIKTTGVKGNMDFSAFDTKKIDEYAALAKASWGETSEYHEYKERSANRTREEENALAQQMMAIFAEMGEHRCGDPASEPVQTLVAKLQDFISKHYYICSRQILSCLGQIYAGGGDMTANIDQAGGEGTAAFAIKAIKIFCAK